MIKVIPAINILGGDVVKLQSGDFASAKVYSANPLEVARQFESANVPGIHLVDLDGARRGSPVNYHVLETITSFTNLDVDFTGGILTDGDINKSFEYGAQYVTAASVAVNNKDLFTSWLMSYGREKIALATDVLDEKIVIAGWQQQTGINIFDLVAYYVQRGLKYLKVTDVTKDGELAGCNVDLLQKIHEQFPSLCVMASGGISHLEEIHTLEQAGVYAVIFGKAFYEGKITLEDIRRLNNPRK